MPEREKLHLRKARQRISNHTVRHLASSKNKAPRGGGARGSYNEEVSHARIWAGFHYRFSVRVGQDMGRKVGRYVLDTIMQPAVDAR